MIASWAGTWLNSWGASWGFSSEPTVADTPSLKRGGHYLKPRAMDYDDKDFLKNIIQEIAGSKDVELSTEKIITEIQKTNIVSDALAIQEEPRDTDKGTDALLEQMQFRISAFIDDMLEIDRRRKDDEIAIMLLIN